jgi:predicted transposase/invertase (TIGR01784 family)
MFSLGDLRETKVYQEGIEEGKELKAKEAIPPLLALGLTVKQIAQALNLSEEIVKQIAENQKNQG